MLICRWSRSCSTPDGRQPTEQRRCEKAGSPFPVLVSSYFPLSTCQLTRQLSPKKKRRTLSHLYPPAILPLKDHPAKTAVRFPVQRVQQFTQHLPPVPRRLTGLQRPLPKPTYPVSTLPPRVHPKNPKAVLGPLLLLLGCPILETVKGILT